MDDLTTGSDLVPTARWSGEALIASIRGEIDMNNSPELRSALLELVRQHPCNKLVLNLSAVPYMDSSAIAVLVELLRELRRRRGRIFLTNLQPRVRGLLEIARLDTIFSVVENEGDAAGK